MLGKIDVAGAPACDMLPAHFKTIEVFEQDTKKKNDNMHAKLRDKYLGIIILDNDEDDDDDNDELEDEVNE